MSKLIFNPITFLGITIISIIFSISLYKSAKRTSYSAENIKSIEEEVLKTEAEVLALEIAIEESQQPFIEEKIIRNELLMKKPGEYVIQIPNELIEQTQTTIEVKTLSPWEDKLKQQLRSKLFHLGKSGNNYYFSARKATRSKPASKGCLIRTSAQKEATSCPLALFSSLVRDQRQRYIETHLQQ